MRGAFRRSQAGPVLAELRLRVPFCPSPVGVGCGSAHEVTDPSQLKKTEIVAVLRRAGLQDAADEANRSLPEKVDVEDVVQFGARFGITREWLTERMGGSP
jgi:hypothetical protein